MKLGPLALSVFVVVLASSCNRENIADPDQVPDYQYQSIWASLPSETDKSVDVFYVYPTLFGGAENLNMDIEDDEMRNRVQAVIPKQAGVFDGECNVFAPYYRQMSMDGLAMTQIERDTYFSVGLADIEAAFDYYIDNLNDSRPFFLAGHSQGSQVLLELMKEKFQASDLRAQLIAAYLIGYSVTDQDLQDCSWLKIAESFDDVGVIVTYNTQAPLAEGSPVLLPGAKCVNPLNWTTSPEYAPKELNRGAVFFHDNGTIDSIAYQFTDAMIHQSGALLVTVSDIDLYSMPGFPRGVFHKYDYSFFFNNLKENVGDRIAAYQLQ